ncbi:tetratricopeptide repeat protein [Segnochrobactrum spirostomi]|uniref:Sel1 repeat family protein n=1 Tax=Segnochrobactrum spirostomi TaxID=2608987 RepID=A0A6A7Y3L4_9HYPH|nr:tetratricopeptide repeat protein [Segnochrobactrum spirostomi]MQT13714.1 hypothetical protein [Segnochrobactrum spirostomi]
MRSGDEAAFAALGTALRHEVSRLAERQTSLEARIAAVAEQPDLSKLDDRLANVASALVAVAEASHQTTHTVERVTNRISHDIAGLKTAVEAMDPDRLTPRTPPVRAPAAVTAKKPEPATDDRPPLVERHAAMAAALRTLGAHFAATRDASPAEASTETATVAPAARMESPEAAHAPSLEHAPAKMAPIEAQVIQASGAPVPSAEAAPAEVPLAAAAPAEPVVAPAPLSPFGLEAGTAPMSDNGAPSLEQARIARLIGTVRRAAPPPEGARPLARRSLTGSLGVWSLSRSEAAVFVLLFTGLSLGAYTSLAKLPILSNAKVDTAIAAVAEPASAPVSDPVATGSLGAAPRESATDPQALFHLASRLERGEGVAANPDRARALYEEAAAAGNVMAMHNLAVMAFEGAGGPRDPALAINWFEKAAEYGLVDSEFNLAVLYLKGLGTQKDPAAAYRWFAIAARTGDAKAANKAAEVGAGLAPAERARIDAEVADWQAAPRSPAANGAVVADAARP